jgi:hypothetical protein
MENIFRFKLTENPQNNDFIEFTILVDGLINESSEVQFKNSVTSPSTQCQIGTDIEDTTTNLNVWVLNWVTARPSIDSYTTLSAYEELGSWFVEMKIVYNVTNTFTIVGDNITINTFQGFQFDILRNSSVFKNYDKTYNTSTNNISFIITGSNLYNTILNTKNNFEVYNTHPSMSYSLFSDEGNVQFLFININDIVDNTYTLDLFSNTTLLDIYGPEVDIDREQLIEDFEITNVEQNSYLGFRARSPYLLITSSSSSFDTVNYNIRVFEGNLSSSSLQPISYIKTKQKIVNTQNNVWINISNLSREDFESDINSYIVNNTITSSILSENESKWVNIEYTSSLTGSIINSGSINLYAIDGYIEPKEIQNIPNLLTTGDKKYINKNSIERIYFKTDNLLGASFTTSTNITPQSISFSEFIDNNQYYIQSLKVDTSKDWVRYIFSYLDGDEIITYNTYDECKYENFNLVFKNKYGVLESLSLSKKATKSLNINSSDYLRSIVDYEGNFDINRHTNKQYNVSGDEEWILNTDYIPEYMNDVIKEAMLSEEMWLIDNFNDIIPVTKLDNSISFKTSLNDKLIQYTIKVKLSHNTVNNII